MGGDLVGALIVVAILTPLIGRATIRREILRNVRVLAEFTGRLDRHVERRLEVRLYRAAASTTLYRWDDRALISFLSLGRHTSQGSQLEIDVDTSLGHFVEQHFDELWGSATTLDGHLRLHLTLTGDPDDGPRDFHLPYVQVDGLHYLADPQVLAHLARVHAGNGTVLATLAGQPDTRFQLRVVDDADQPLREGADRSLPGEVRVARPGVPVPRRGPGDPPDPVRAPPVTTARRSGIGCRHGPGNRPAKIAPTRSRAAVGGRSMRP